MSRTATLTILVIVLIVVLLLVTVNVTKCDTFSAFGFLRFTACEEAPILDPG